MYSALLNAAKQIEFDGVHIAPNGLPPCTLETRLLQRPQWRWLGLHIDLHLGPRIGLHIGLHIGPRCKTRFGLAQKRTRAIKAASGGMDTGARITENAPLLATEEVCDAIAAAGVQLPCLLHDHRSTS